ncbi:MAG: FtsB family cell division protein [Thermoleophilaceae bacterium]
MPRSSRRAVRPNRFARPATAAVLLGAGLFLAAAFVGIAAQTNALARETAAREAEIAVLRAQRALLEAQIGTKVTDDYVRDRAIELGFARPGEEIIAVQREEPAPALPAPARGPDRLLRWLALFFP